MRTQLTKDLKQNVKAVLFEDAKTNKLTLTLTMPKKQIEAFLLETGDTPKAIFDKIVIIES